MDTREIVLNHGKVALVDAADYFHLSRWKWRAYFNAKRQCYRATRVGINAQGRKTTVQMSRQLLGLNAGDNRQADHINGNTLDNRRSNLRIAIATHAENQRNKKGSRNSKSGLKGATFNKNRGLYMACIRIERKQKFLGYHQTAQQAHDAYCAAAKEHYGEFARFA